MYDDTIKDIIQKLNPEIFFKINRKFIVNKEAVTEIIKHSSQKVEIKLFPEPEVNAEVFISKMQIAECLNWLNK
ncbi:LytTR family DNA-binding domain-containing protein [Chryseobacterium sp. CH21]|uniref:LytTR family DNA-binding domain-containing protein n=1 Tax=Chryseobacterium sp. CH21 TaxID=713556 RepID=UPI001E64735A|nr:LytTR family DNA-binding domain-containing protein [Chryseobacterium sp. CH21]